MQERSLFSACSVVPVGRYGACEIAWHRWEPPGLAVCGVVPVAAIVPVFPYSAHTGTIKGLLLLYSPTIRKVLYRWKWVMQPSVIKINSLLHVGRCIETLPWRCGWPELLGVSQVKKGA